MHGGSRVPTRLRARNAEHFKDFETAQTTLSGAKAAMEKVMSSGRAFRARYVRAILAFPHHVAMQIRDLNNTLPHAANAAHFQIANANPDSYQPSTAFSASSDEVRTLLNTIEESFRKLYGVEDPI